MATQQPPSTEKLDKFYSQFLNEKGKGILAEYLVVKELIYALSDTDLDQIKENSIYFNPVPSPASRSKLNQPLVQGSSIVTIDTNSTSLFSPREVVAIILHEIGHALKPQLTNMEGEYSADDYAVERGFGTEIISSLIISIQRDPANYNNQSTDLRLKRIGKLLEKDR